ncbi:MAG TPA: hypothetical protein VIN65_06280 [Candidatus Dormibacteraeota bacterium]
MRNPPGLRGTALHLSSATSITFTEPQTLIRFLAGAGPGSDAEAVAADEIGHDNVLKY